MSTGETRAEIEAKRGIVRDENGKIIRSKKWIKDRVDLLKFKRSDCVTRIANIDAEIKSRTKELSSK